MSEMILYHGTTRVLKDPGNRTEELLCHREAEPAKAAAASLPNGGYLNIYRFETEGLTEGTDYSVLNREVLIKSVEAKKQLKHLAFGPVDKRADGIGKEDIKNRMEVLGELFSCVAGKENEDITSSEFTVFHVLNSHTVEMGNVILAMQRCGYDIEIVTEGEFQSRLRDALARDDVNAYVAPLVNYRLDDDEMRYELSSDNSFTIKALYRLGFQWSITDMGYLEAAIRMIGLLGFFEM